jgi:glycine/D-amino acid oxidase-like deaminating enzyme
MPAFDLVVACQAVPDIEPALRLAQTRGAGVPPLIEHGGLVAEAERTSGLAARYIGVCAAIRDAAAERLPGREHHAIEIPSMVDLAEFVPGHRADVRNELRLGPDDVAFGWVGRLDRKKRVEDFLRAAALLAETELLAEWAGLYEVTPDDQPILGRLPHADGLFVCAGFSGHGLMHGPAAGLLMAEEILDGRARTIDIDALRWGRFASGADAAEFNVV